MNIRESNGESSCKGQENGDESTGSERPLKKARFAWQVKGKYHLKNEISDAANTPSIASKTHKPSSSNENNANNMGTGKNLEMLSNCLQDSNTLDSVDEDSEKSFFQPNTSVSTEQLQNPGYVSSQDNNLLNGFSDIIDLKTMPFISTPISTEDLRISRWQLRQVAMCLIDNTANRVIESSIDLPQPAEHDDTRFAARDVAELINHLPDDNSIENEGILMAISTHGLKNTSNSSTVSNEETNDFESKVHHAFSTSSLFSSSSDEEPPVKLDDDNNENDLLDTPWLHDNDKDNDIHPCSLFPEATISHQCFNKNIDTIEHDENCSTNHDFLDVAITFAIQNKGLTTFRTDYG